MIFITEKDYYQAGKAVYMIQNMNQTLNQPFGDGAHILYVNGEYRDDSAIGKLMHGFQLQQMQMTCITDCWQKEQGISRKIRRE